MVLVFDKRVRNYTCHPHCLHSMHVVCVVCVRAMCGAVCSSDGCCLLFACAESGDIASAIEKGFVAMDWEMMDGKWTSSLLLWLLHQPMGLSPQWYEVMHTPLCAVR